MGRGKVTEIGGAKPPKQEQIPGTERKQIPEIEKIAVSFAEVQGQRISLTAEEVDLGDQLVAVMKKHGLSVYEMADDRFKRVEITPTKEKVRRRKDHDAEG